ncbi:hypothetical protein DSECCO2_531530 [anaerobic digester metagenome]
MSFHETVAGHRFFNHQLPELIKALQGIAGALSRPQPVIQVPTENSEKVLRDLFYEQFEPDIWSRSQQSHEYDRAIKAHQARMRETLSPGLWEMAEEYRKLLEERHFFEVEKSFESGYATAIKMITAGLAATPRGQAKEEGAKDE